MNQKDCKLNLLYFNIPPLTQQLRVRREKWETGNGENTRISLREKERKNMRSTVLVPRSLRKASVPPALLSDPTPGSLQPTRLAAHVSMHTSSRPCPPGPRNLSTGTS